MLIREIKIEDAESLINLIKEVEAESKYMRMEPGERNTTQDQQRIHLERLGKQHNSTIFVAEQEGKLIGYLIAVGGSVKRTKHSAYIVIGISGQYRGQGVGTALFRRVEEWAGNHHISRLELTVVTTNEAGVALYKKSGFEIEGIKKNSLMIDGAYYDEYFMAKVFS